MKKSLEEMTFKQLKAEVSRMLKRGELSEKELIEFIRSRDSSHLQKRIKIEDLQNL